jgi:hypothetical protein
VTRVGDGEAAAILMMHHAVADGMAMLAIAAGLRDPPAGASAGAR